MQPRRASLLVARASAARPVLRRLRLAGLLAATRCRPAVSSAGEMYLTGLSIRLLALLTGQAVAIIDRGFTRYQQLASAPAATAAEVAPATA
jgi:hypothetical protein